MLGPVYITALSPSPVLYRSPEPLVLQVEAGGEYAGIEWTRTPIALNVSSDELLDFQQTFVRTVTSDDLCGLYQANLICSNDCAINTTLKWNISAGASVSCKYSTRAHTVRSTQLKYPSSV